MSVTVRPSPWILIPLLTALGLGGCGSSQTPEATAPLPVKVIRLSSVPVVDSALYVGTLQAIRKVVLKPQIQGRIRTIPVASGAQVEPGQVLFALEPDQTLPQYQSSLAGVAQTRDQLTNAQTQLRVSQSRLKEAIARFNLAEVNYRRTRLLIREGAIAQLVADQAATEYKVSREQVQVARRETEAAETVVRQTQAQVFRSQADSASARVSFDFKQVRSPIAGQVGDITLRPGDLVTNAQTLTTITDNSAFDLAFSVPANRASQLRSGLTVLLEKPGSEQVLGEGRLNFISPETSQMQQAVTVKARFPNRQGRLRDSQFVQARLIWRTGPGLRVPASAVTRIGGQAFVYTVSTQTGQPTARQQPVSLGLLQQQSYPVLSGLKVGDRLIVSNLLQLRPNLPVQPQTLTATR